MERSESSKLMFCVTIIGVVRSFSFQHKAFFYYNVVQTTNDKYINGTHPLPTDTCEVSTKSSPCNITPNIKLTLKEDLNRPTLFIRVSELSTNKTLLQQMMNVCSMSKQPGLNIFVRFIRDQLQESTNFKFECPIRKVAFEMSQI